MEVVTYLHMRHILPVLGTWEVALWLLKKEKTFFLSAGPGRAFRGSWGSLGAGQALVGSSGDSQDLFCCFFSSSSSFFLLLFLLILL